MTSTRPAPHTGGTAAVLLHGLCSTPEELLPVQYALERAGCTAVALRIPGYSFDAACEAQQASPYRTWLQAIAETVAQLRTTHARVALVGISAGASLALGAALAAVPVDMLVLLSTPLVLDGWAVPRTQFLLPLALYTPLGRWWRYRERPPYGVKNERVRAWIARELETRRCSSAGAAVLGVPHLREHDRLVRHVRRHLPRITGPRVLAIHAREDEVASPANLDLLARALPAGRLTTRLLHDSYHMISIDNDRLEVARATVGFVLGSVDAAAPFAPPLSSTPS